MLSMLITSNLYSIEQYTPLQPPEKVGEGKVRSLNNYKLASLLESYKPGTYFDASSMDFKEEYDQVDPNQPRLKLNCITSPAGLINPKSSWNCLHYAAYYGSDKALAALVEAIERLKIQPIQPPTRKKKNKDKKTLLESLLLQSNNLQLTPFELALARGNISTAIELIKIGALRSPGKKKSEKELGEKAEQDEDTYTGLDFKGKKLIFGRYKE